MKKSLLLPAALLTAAALTACGSSGGSDSAAAGSASDEPQNALNIAMTPLGDDPTAENPVEAFAELVTEKTGATVEITDVPDYLSVVEALRGGHVDFGLMSGFPSALAVNTGDVDALLAWKGDDSPVSTCMVLADSEITELTDLRGKKVAFADQASSSGYFMPVHMLDKAGLTRDEDYEAIFAGGHDAGWSALKNGGVDATCTAMVLTDMSVEYGIFAAGETRNVGESASMPVSTVILVRSGMNDATRQMLIDALPAVFSENTERLGVLGKSQQGEVIVEPDASVFAPLNEIAGVAGVELENLGS